MKIKQISKKKASVLNLMFNYGNAMFAIVNGLVLLPIYLTYFSVGTYGSFLSSGNIVGMLGLLEGGSAFVLTQKLASSYAKKDFKVFSNLLGSGLFISIALTVVLIIIGIAFFPFIAGWVKAEPSEYSNIQYAFLLSAIGAGLNITFNNMSAAFQAWLKVQISGVANLISIFFGIATTLTGLKIGLGVVSIPLGVLIKALVGNMILSFYLFSNLRINNYPKIRVNKENASELIRATLPIFGGSVAKSLVANSQLLIITSFINPAASAIFFITGRIYLVCDSFLAPVGSSIFSSISHFAGSGETAKVKKNLVHIFIVFSCFSAVILSCSFVLNQPFISLLLGGDKFGGVWLSALMGINMLFYTRCNFLSVNLFALGVFGKTVFYDFISGITRLILIFVLIRYIGYIAIPIAELLTTSLLLSYFINKLIINKLEMKSGEAIRFVFAGGWVFIVISAMAIVWYQYIPRPLNIIHFVGQGMAFLTATAVIVWVLSKESRDIFYNLLIHLKIKKAVN
ncbi:MAG: hypothetical protein V4594_02245 [Bacteroidota bacterium]